MSSHEAAASLQASHATLRFDPDEPLLVVVVGSEPRAEVEDRPLAHALVEHVNRWARERSGAGTAALPMAFVASDLWYLNNNHLRLRPAISIGSPDVNAFSAFLIGRLPAVFTVQDELAVHADPELQQSLACAWGASPAHTRRAVEHLIAKTLPVMLEQAVATLS